MKDDERTEYITCDRCPDKDTCEYAGDDPFNRNGECIAMK